MLADPAYITWWRATSRDAAGRLTGHRTGNGLVTIQDYDRATGQLNTIQTGFGHGDLIRHLDYDYDGLNRLVTSTVDGNANGIAYHAETTYVYDALGNMLNKSDVGTYLYGNAAKSVGNAGPHALSHAANDPYIYDDNGSITEGGGRSITWTSFNKPTSFQKDGTVVQFHYGPDRARYKKTVGGMVGFDETTLYLGKSYERVEKSNGEVTHKYFIYADDGLAAIHIEHEDGNGVIDESRDETRYLHRDALGSIDTITDGQGVIVERSGYSPFGERRAGDWRTIGGLNLALYTNRGFTGHEHIDEVGLIHMNGRVYDPQLGRFLSADPHVQAPYSSQSYNRYAYAMNNPLKYTDPSGYFFKKLFKSIKKFFKKYGKLILTIAVGVLTSGVALGFTAAGAFGFGAATLGQLAFAGAVGGFFGGLVSTGSIKGALKGALIGAVSAGVAHGIAGADFSAFGAAFEVARDITHGLAQGIISELSGGDFRSGFAGGFIGHFGGRQLPSSLQKMPGPAGVAARTMAAAVIGGTAAALGGGKFANGAVSGAFAHLFNSETEGWLQKSRNLALDRREHFYSHETVVCGGGNPTCTPNAAADGLLRHPAPGASGMSQVKTGDTTHIEGFGTVDHFVDDDGMGVWNVTQADHTLHPGWVHRRIVVRGDSVVIKTYGGGWGNLAGVNENLDWAVWGVPDQKIWTYLRCAPRRAKRRRVVPGRDEGALFSRSGEAG